MLTYASSREKRKSFQGHPTSIFGEYHKDLRLGQIVYKLVFYNISFSWLRPLDGFQFIFFLLRDGENDPVSVKRRLSLKCRLQTESRTQAGCKMQNKDCILF